ncbi:unnamed protein product [Penicillium crustosum]
MRTALDGGGHGRISKDLVHTLNRDGDAMHENAGLRCRRSLSIGGVLELEEADKGGAALGRKKFG